jgi:cyanate permease
VVSRAWLLLGLMWLAGSDLRLTLLAVPPVLPLIHRDLNLDEKGVAALSGLPVLLLGIAAVPGSLLIARVGPRRALIFGLAVIGLSSALRGLGPGVPVLFAMTFCMGVGISFCQPTLPTLVRQWFPHAVTRATGFWSNGLLVGELLSAALTLPVVLPLVGSWEACFVMWSASAVIGLVPLSILARPLTSYAVAAATLVSLVVVLSGPGLPLVMAAGVFGFCAAYILVLSFALPALLAEPAEVSRLSAGTFAISYSTAFLMTLLTGAVWDATHVEASAFLPALAGSAVVAVLGPSLVLAAAGSARPEHVLATEGTDQRGHQ